MEFILTFARVLDLLFGSPRDKKTQHQWIMFARWYNIRAKIIQIKLKSRVTILSAFWIFTRSLPLSSSPESRRFSQL